MKPILLTGIAAAIFLFTGMACSNLMDCFSQTAQNQVLSIIRKDILVAMTRSDNPAMKAVAELRRLLGISSVLGQSAPTSEDSTGSLRETADMVKLKFITVTQESVDGEKYMCNASIRLQIPHSPNGPLVGDVSLKFTVQPNLTEPVTPIVKLYW